jgi:hypothetical protein
MTYHSTMRILLAVAATAALAPITATSLSAQSSGTYITTSVKGDTFAVETFNRTQNQVVGEIHIKSIRQRLTYTLVLGEGDLVSRLDAAVRPDTGAASPAPVQSLTASFHSDSMLLQTPGGSKTIPTKTGTLPWINPSFSMIEQIVRRAHRLDPGRAHADTLPAVDLNSGPMIVVVSWSPSDSAVVAFPNTTARVALDHSDHIVGVILPDGTTMHTHQLQH